MENNFDYRMEEWYQKLRQNAKEKYFQLLEKVNSENATAQDYFNLYCAYSNLKDLPKVENESDFSQEEMDKYEEMAIQAAEKDIYNGYETANANNYLSHIYYLKKNYENAIFYISRAIELQPKNIDFYFSRAYIYKCCGQKYNAKIDYATAKRINPNLYKKRMDELRKIEHSAGNISITTILFIVFAFISILLCLYRIFLFK